MEILEGATSVNAKCNCGNAGCHRTNEATRAALKKEDQVILINEQQVAASCELVGECSVNGIEALRFYAGRLFGIVPVVYVCEIWPNTDGQVIQWFLGFTKDHALKRVMRMIAAEIGRAFSDD